MQAVEPWSDAYVPGEQGAQAPSARAPYAVENVPPAQGLQMSPHKKLPALHPVGNNLKSTRRPLLSAGVSTRAYP